MITAYIFVNQTRHLRAHLNDLENIPAFLFVSFLYIMTNPALGFATTLFRAFTIARCVHTFVYAVKPLPQPSRALAFGVGLLTTGYMAVQVLIHFW
jgi:glutathione S-transferase